MMKLAIGLIVAAVVGMILLVWLTNIEVERLDREEDEG